ncbi:MAG: hypothetical protein U0441_33085 [Polyangiaceae bacterium]
MSAAMDLDLVDIAPVSTANHEVGDRAIAGSCCTHDGSTPTPLYEFRPERDGAFGVDGTILVWQENGATLQWSIHVGWRRVTGDMEPMGMPFIGGNRKRTHVRIYTDVWNGKGRVMVIGLDNKRLYWRIKGVLFDLTC